MAEPSRESDLMPATAAMSLMATLLSCRSLPEIESNRGIASPASFELVTTEVFGPPRSWSSTATPTSTRSLVARGQIDNHLLHRSVAGRSVIPLKTRQYPL